MSSSDIKHFIEQRIEDDLAKGTYAGAVVTRFPPEPNGYLHIGHAKSICLNFTLAKQYGGRCHLRFDDTNPTKEDLEFIHAIEEDVKWLGFQWDSKHFTSDYFDTLYEYAVQLIKSGDAFVCSLSPDEIRAGRGTLTEPGQNSPFRSRSIEENIDLFTRMKAGEFADGTHVLRAKIDMTSGNINMRDPVIYRLLHATHPHVGDTWHVYPMYDFAHCLSDAIENITHSLCTLEFQDHRPLYDWLLARLTPSPRPQQIEFSRLNLTHTITSKRTLKQLVDAQHVAGWDDPRFSTLKGMRRRGFTPRGIQNFCKEVGISKSDSLIDFGLLEEAVRDDLNQTAARAMCVLNPLKVVLTDLPEDYCETLTAANHPQNVELGERTMSLTREIYIDADDFMLEPEKKYFRLAPGKEVRLRYGYVIKCEHVVQDEKTGEVIEVHCSYDKDTLGKKPEGRKVKGVIHWVSARHHKRCQVRLYDRLFLTEQPARADTFAELVETLNPNSLIELKDCFVEPNLLSVAAETAYQFERVGYFVVDRVDSNDEQLVFNRVVSLRDSWVKVKGQ